MPARGLGRPLPQQSLPPLSTVAAASPPSFLRTLTHRSSWVLDHERGVQEPAAGVMQLDGEPHLGGTIEDDLENGLSRPRGFSDEDGMFEADGIPSTLDRGPNYQAHGTVQAHAGEVSDRAPQDVPGALPAGLLRTGAHGATFDAWSCTPMPCDTTAQAVHATA